MREAAIDAHIPFIEEAGRRGVQILGLQEVFNGPYFCPSQDAHWYDIAEPVPGPTTELMAAYAKQVPDGDGRAGLRARAGRRLLQHRGRLRRRRHATSASTARTTSRTPRGFWEKYFFKPGNLGYPVFKTRYATIGVYICYDRHFPEGARLLGLNGAEIVFNPSATVAGLSQYLWKLEQPAHAVANGYFMACSNRVGTEAPWNIGRFYGSSYFVDPRGNFLATASEDKDELVIAEMDLDMIEEVRRVWQFYRDRRPETYAPAGGAAVREPPDQERHRSSPPPTSTSATCSSRARRITAIGTALTMPADRVDRRHAASYVLPGRHRRPHAPRHAVRRHDVGRRLRVRARSRPRIGGTTTIVDFAIQYQRPDAAPRAGRRG